MDRAPFEMGEIVNPFRNFVGCETERAFAEPNWLRLRRRGIIPDKVEDQT